MMPLYYGGAQFTLDLSRNHALRNKALDWFEKVGDIRSAHFNDVRVVCNYALELQVQVSKEKKVTVKETKGPYAQYRLRLVPALSSAHPTPSILYNELIENLQSKLDKSVKNNNTGYLGGVESVLVAHSTNTGGSGDSLESSSLRSHQRAGNNWRLHRQLSSILSSTALPSTSLTMS